MRIIIVDDERKILQDLKDTIQNYDDFEVVGTYINPLQALDDFSNVNPDCAFLDIEMPGITGIELAERLLSINPHIYIVFITAFNHYATQAFEVNAMDYVLKPVNPIRFDKTIDKLNKYKEKYSLINYNKIKICSFGYFDVLLDGKSIKWNRSKSRELLAYLLHFEGRKRTKYVICEDLWPDYEYKKALAHLQTAMCSLRKSLANIDRSDMQIDFIDESYVLLIGHLDWDLREFENIYEQFQENGNIKMGNKAISIYHGDYMESEDWSWSQLLAESLARKYGLLLKRLAEHSFIKRNFFETIEFIHKLAIRQPVTIELQLLLAESAYSEGGINGLAREISFIREIYQKSQDTDLEPEIFDYCTKKGLQI